RGDGRAARRPGRCRRAAARRAAALDAFAGAAAAAAGAARAEPRAGGGTDAAGEGGAGAAHAAAAERRRALRADDLPVAVGRRRALAAVQGSARAPLAVLLRGGGGRPAQGPRDRADRLRRTAPRRGGRRIAAAAR